MGTEETRFERFEILAAAVRSPRPLESVIDLVIGQIADVVPIDAAAVWLHNSENDYWYIGGGRGLTTRAAQVRFTAADEPLHDKVGEEGEIVANPGSAGFRRLYPEHHLVQGALYAPMKIAGRRVGLIALYRNSPSPFVEDDLRFVRTVGSQLGMAVSFAALESRAERLAVREERARIGADLHDGIQQILSSIRVYAEELRSGLTAAGGDLPKATAVDLADTLSALETCLETGSTDVAAAVGSLRSPDAQKEVRGHLAAARARLEDAGIATKLVCEIEDISPEVADAVGWIAREAASNVIQHSRAERASILARSVDGEIELTIEDDGVGVPGAATADGDPVDDSHLGRRIMRERADHIGGTLSVEARPSGTAVQARVPAVPISAA
ncbi:MAG: GAF domain-containing protein [Solirubrobacterales bacterium]